jgi:hypothetical protein
MGESADGDEVNARLRDGSGRLQPQPSAGFQPGQGITTCHGRRRAEIGQVHVVEQDEPGAGVQGLTDLGQGVALHLERQPGRGRPYGGDRRRDPARRRHVVVLYQRGVAESHPVVHAAAAPHGVLLELAQARGGLAGVTHRAPRAGQGVNPGPGRGGDSGQVSEKVEQGSFGAE